MIEKFNLIRVIILGVLLLVLGSALTFFMGDVQSDDATYVSIVNLAADVVAIAGVLANIYYIVTQSEDLETPVSKGVRVVGLCGSIAMMVSAIAIVALGFVSDTGAWATVGIDFIMLILLANGYLLYKEQTTKNDK